jgi:hypothetical protein
MAIELQKVAHVVHRAQKHLRRVLAFRSRQIAARRRHDAANVALHAQNELKIMRWWRFLWGASKKDDYHSPRIVNSRVVAEGIMRQYYQQNRDRILRIFRNSYIRLGDPQTPDIVDVVYTQPLEK